MARSYPTLYTPFVWGSFLIAVFGGFLLAAYLSVSMGSGWWSGTLLFELIQLHGHLQLVGWMGMLLLGVSLYLLPRLLSASLPVSKADKWIFVLLLLGILLRVVATFSEAFAPLTKLSGSTILLLSVLFELAAIILYLFICFKLVQSVRAGNNDLKRLWPYFAAMFFGWALFALLQLWLSLFHSGETSALINPQWSGFVNDVFVRLVLIPALFGFGVKMLPVFLGLTPPLWPVRSVGLVLFVSTLTYLLGKALVIIAPEASIFFTVQMLGLLGISASVLAFIWFLDALLFRILPERIALKVHRSDVKEQRGRFGDKGEYGRFELFIVVGFAWLAIIALLEATNAIRQLVGYSELISYATLRHGLLLGALSHLVLGVSHRLLPSLLGKKLFSPGLTVVCFLLLFLASLLRVVPLMFSDLGHTLPMTYFSWSGVVGLFAISIAGMNIVLPLHSPNLTKM